MFKDRIEVYKYSIKRNELIKATYHTFKFNLYEDLLGSYIILYLMNTAITLVSFGSYIIFLVAGGKTKSFCAVPAMLLLYGKFILLK